MNNVEEKEEKTEDVIEEVEEKPQKKGKLFGDPLAIINE